jgi:hypothetical protein
MSEPPAAAERLHETDPEALCYSRIATLRTFFYALAVIVVAAAAHGQTGTPPLRVGTITVRPLDVYSAPEARRGRFYRLADRLHIETHASVIRRFLLFHEGEPFRRERLAETERNLRALHFLKSASVTASEPHDGVVDITVTTQDAWSIAPETQAGNKGGASSYGASITDTNVFGFGKEISVSWDKTVDRTRYGIDYQDPALNRSFWTTHLAYGHNSDGRDHRAILRRPFYSFATPWAAELSFVGFMQTDRLYAEGIRTAKFQQDHRMIVASWGRALDPNDRTANRISGGVRIIRDDFANIEGRDELLPLPRDFRYLFARFEHIDNDFLKLDYVNKDMRYEDFNLGRQYSLETGVSPKVLGSEATTAMAAASFADGIRAGGASFFIPSCSVSTRFEGGPRNTIAAASLYFVNRYDTGYPQATVARVAFTGGWRLDRERQFFADGLTGLRGYRAWSFEGDRAVVANFEHRFYLGHELLQLFSPGLVVFADTGNATSRGFEELMHLKTDVGVGLRIGLPRTPKNLLRLDVSYALNHDPRGRRGMLVSFSSGQAF